MRPELVGPLFTAYLVCAVMLWTYRKHVLAGCKILGNYMLIAKCNVKLAWMRCRDWWFVCRKYGLTFEELDELRRSGPPYAK
jgi:hypothetical protein